MVGWLGSVVYVFVCLVTSGLLLGMLLVLGLRILVCVGVAWFGFFGCHQLDQIIVFEVRVCSMSLTCLCDVFLVLFHRSYVLFILLLVGWLWVLCYKQSKPC